MSSNPKVSHGRGGAGNIDRDSNTYTDGAIVREGPVGDQGDGAYSSGRGGAGNIASPCMKPTNNANTPGDDEVVPEPAVRVRHAGDDYKNYHTGRGGGGNVHREEGSGSNGGIPGTGTGNGSGGEQREKGKIEELKEKVLHPFQSSHGSHGQEQSGGSGNAE